MDGRLENAYQLLSIIGLTLMNNTLQFETLQDLQVLF